MTQPAQTRPAAINGNGNGHPAIALPKPAPMIEMHEAPYSWTLSVVDANGFNEIFTVRGVTERGFFDRITSTKARLLKQGYKPAPQRNAQAPERAAEAEQTPLCAIHKTPMVKRQNARGSFYSCPQRLDNGEFCPYRPK